MSFNNNLGLPDNYMTSNNSIISYGEIDFYCIFDRTQADVDRVEYLTRVILAHENTEEEFEEYQQDLKGALNYSDLERIENNITLLASWIGLPLEDMSRNVIPRIPYFINLLENVKIIRESPYHYTSSPQVPDMPLTMLQQLLITVI